MKLLLVLLVVAFVVWAVYMVVKMLRKRKVTETNTHARIRAQVSEDLNAYRNNPTAIPVSRPSVSPTKTYEMKSKKNREDDDDEGSVNFGYWDTDGGATNYYDSPRYEAPASTPVYESPTRSETPSTSYESPSSTYSSGSSDSSSSGSSSSSD